MKTRYALFVLLAVTFASCNRLDIPGIIVSGGEDPETRVETWLEWNAQNPAFVLNDVPDDYCFYACSDVHVTDDGTRVKNFMTAERNDVKAQFGIILGDLANESGERPFQTVTDAIAYDENVQAENDPCYAIIGNHDIYFDCWEHYRDYFHTSTYCITINLQSGAKDLIICLDSGNGTHGRRQLEWLSDVLKDRGQYRYCIVCTHNCLFRNYYNYTTTPAANLPLDEQYALMHQMSENDVNLFLMGHFHHREEETFDGVRYVMTDNLNTTEEAPTYLVVCCGDRLTYQYVELEME